ncbi:MAG: zf-TFIIB domain-containing protein [Chthonomonadaceae bacterium]|jgi:Zn-finger nucleic acid-binding protein|nr:zf-TFIIB domain-containing protein [Chthonomonadaceae bacterium]
MKCPGCGNELASTFLGSTLVEVCSNCGGIWFDEAELIKVITDDPASMNMVDQVQHSQATEISHIHRRCPKCECVMSSYHYAYKSAILLDGCDQCGGIFVDQGELTDIESFRLQELQPDAKGQAAMLLAEFVAESHDRRERAMMFARSALIRKRTGVPSFSKWLYSDDAGVTQ